MSSASMNTENEASMEHDYITERPERDAKFFARMGWILAIVGAGSFFTWASWRRSIKAFRCRARSWCRASAKPCNR